MQSFSRQNKVFLNFVVVAHLKNDGIAATKGCKSKWYEKYTAREA